jgi:hypothetical protein
MKRLRRFSRITSSPSNIQQSRLLKALVLGSEIFRSNFWPTPQIAQAPT